MNDKIVTKKKLVYILYTKHPNYANENTVHADHHTVTIQIFKKCYFMMFEIAATLKTGFRKFSTRFCLFTGDLAAEIVCSFK